MRQMYVRCCFRRGPKRLCMYVVTLVLTTACFMTLLQIHYSATKSSASSLGRLLRASEWSVKRDAHNGNTSSGNQPAQACVHPQLELWHPSVKSFFHDVPPLSCAEDEDWVYVTQGRLKLNPNARKKHGDIVCNAAPLTFFDDQTVTEGTRKRIKDGDVVPSDFFEVKCFGQRTHRTYINIHSSIAHDDSLQKRFTNSQVFQKGLGMNILMFGFDSVSRMTWMRNLPKSYKYLIDVLGGTVLQGYNIVGDGTPQALLPILTGQTEMELPEARRGRAGARPVDGHPWIWKELKQLGYVTQWGEDGASYGTFHYRMLGFKEQPVDHYLRTFYLRAERIYRLHKPYCLGSVPRHTIMLNWIKELFHTYPTQPKFSFIFHSEFTHGDHSSVRVVDDDLLEFLTDMNENGHLNNTLLILMSDHGARFQDVRQTIQGKYEERLPFFSLTFPPWFKKNYPQQMRNLRANAYKLTSPFDIHATFKDIINFSGTTTASVTDRGISLLKEIPAERTCMHANIQSHWCACLSWKDVSVMNPAVKGAVDAVIKKFNHLTEPKRSLCEMLNLSKIVTALAYEPNDNVLKFKQSKDMDGRIADLSDHMIASEVFYQVTFETSPNKGMYEVTVKKMLGDGVFIVDEKSISRINKYGSDPHCISSTLPHLNPYCYCKGPK